MRRLFVRLSLSAAIVSGPALAKAADLTWTNLNNSQQWTNALNWTPGTVPNGAGDIARITANITAARAITNNVAVTLGGLLIGDKGSSYYNYSIVGNGSFTFDNGASPAWVCQTQANNLIDIPMTLNSDLWVTNLNTASAMRFGGAISGGKSITLFGPGAVKFQNSGTTFSGGITNYVELRTLATTSLGTGPIVMMGGSGMGADNAGYTFSNNFSVLGDCYLGYNANAFALYGGFDLNGAARVLSVTGVVTLAGVISNGGLTVNGLRTLVLNGANTFSDGLTVSPGATLAGSGSVASATTIGGVLAPGTDGTAGTFTVYSNLWFAAGATNLFDLDADAAVVGGGNDLVSVAGDLGLDGALVVNPTWFSEGTYQLFNYGGALTGAVPALSFVNARLVGTVVTTTANQVDLQIASAGTNLVWTGVGSTNWNLNASTNWNNGAGADVFLTGDRVLFDDTAACANLVMNSVLNPQAVVFNNSVSNYMVTASGGRLSGSTGLLKTGTGVLTIGGANDFTGDVVVSNGTFKANNDLSFGATNGATYVIAGATMDVNGGRDFGAEHFYVAGAGVGGTGAVVNTGAAAQNALEYVTLTGDTTFGGTGRFDVRDGGRGAALDGLYTLTKMGGNQVSLVGATVNIGRLEIVEGKLNIETTTTINPEYEVRVHEGGTLGFWALPAPMGRDVYLTNATLYAGSGGSLTNNRMSGAVAVEGSVTNDVAPAVYLCLLGDVSGAGGMVKNTNTGTLVLSGNNTYGGGTVVRAGTVLLGHDQALGPGPLTMNGGTLAPLDTGARTITNALLIGGNFGLGLAGSGPLTLTSDADLGGVARTLTVNSTTTLSGVLTNGGLVKAGAGALILPGANPYELGTTISAGALAVGNDQTLGTGPLTLSGGRLSSDGIANRSLTNPVVITAASFLGDVTNTGVLTLSGGIDFNGAARNLTVDSDVRLTAPSSNGGVNQKLGAGALTILAGGDWTRGGALEIRGGDVVIDGVAVTNQDAFRIMNVTAGGTSRLVLTNGALLVCTNLGANLRIGHESSNNRVATNIVELAGTLVLTSAGTGGYTQIGSDSTNAILNLYPGGALFTRGINDNGTDAGFAGAARTLNFHGGALVATLSNTSDFISLDYATAANHVYVHAGGAIIDSQGFDITVPQALENGTGGADGGLVKQGAGLLTLSGVNTYNGPTVISNGTLQLGASGSIGNSSRIHLASITSTADVSLVTGGFHLLSGQELKGSGTLRGGLIMDAGARLAPGNSAGTLNVAGDLTLATGTTNTFDLVGPNGGDEVLVGGTLNLGGIQFTDFVFSPDAGLGADQTYTLFHSGGAVAGSLGAVTNGTVGAYAAYLQVGGAANDDLQLKVIPEPGTAGLLALGLAAELLRRRRRRARG